ncbi:MAG: hypothetical protein QXW98_06765 [Candidatus Caldarchaeum sp.]
MLIERKSNTYKYAKIVKDSIVVDGQSYQGIEGNLVRLERRLDKYQDIEYYRYLFYFQSDDNPNEYIILAVREDSTAAEKIITKLATYVDMVENGIFSIPPSNLRVRLYIFSRDNRINYSIEVDKYRIYSRYVYGSKVPDSYSLPIEPIILPPFQWVPVSRGRWIKSNIAERLDFIANLAEKVTLFLIGLKVKQTFDEQ